MGIEHCTKTLPRARLRHDARARRRTHQPREARAIGFHLGHPCVPRAAHPAVPGGQSLPNIVVHRIERTAERVIAEIDPLGRCAERTREKRRDMRRERGFGERATAEGGDARFDGRPVTHLALPRRPLPACRENIRLTLARRPPLACGERVGMRGVRLVLTVTQIGDNTAPELHDDLPLPTSGPSYLPRRRPPIVRPLTVIDRAFAIRARLARPPRRGLRLMLVLACGLTVASCGDQGSVHSIRLSECRLPKVAQAVQCGTLEVPENRERPNGRKLSIFVAVLPANTLSPKPDPLVLLAGGPGQAESSLGPFASQLTAVRRTRDIVLIDQRGTGRSSPLSCPALAPDEHAEFDTDPVPKATLCAQQLAANGVDASQYTTSAWIADLDSMRE